MCSCTKSNLFYYYSSECCKVTILVFKVPGKPQKENIRSDSVSLLWKKPHEETGQFQVRFKVKDEKSGWKFAETNVVGNCTIITGLMADTEYVFQVRGLFGDQEGPYGPVSDCIKTKKSLATTLLNFCVKPDSKMVPLRYQLPVEENINARNESARTRQLILGMIKKFLAFCSFVFIASLPKSDDMSEFF